MKIILIGYMASGKSTIGTLISDKINIPFLDLDVEIEKKLNLSCTEIFKTKGELFFRKIEKEILTEILNTNQNYVLALGGGTPCYFDNFKLYQPDIYKTIYLKGSLKTLLTRLKSETIKRPLLEKLNFKELNSFVAKHLFERSFYYHQVKTIINIDNKKSAEIVSEIILKLT